MSSPATTWNYLFTIGHVHDGDTVVGDIDLGMKIWRRSATVRIFGYDAPELKDEIRLGVFAKAALSGILEIGSTVWLVSRAFDDKYGRILGDFQTDSLPSVAVFGAAEGWLKPYTGEGPKPWAISSSGATFKLGGKLPDGQ